MAVPARAVAAALRERLPGLGTVKLHKLLYYCQGHHLATFDAPLFAETISAWDMGPVVGTLWREEKDGAPADETDTAARLGEAELNTVGYVVSRYGALTGKDLEHLTHSEAPWQTANRIRQPGGRVTIRPEWIREYFRTDGGPVAGDEEDLPLDSEAVAQWLAGVQEPPPVDPDAPDDREKLLAMRAELLARLRCA
jgi:uncharacterized phage-associated protein